MPPRVLTVLAIIPVPSSIALCSGFCYPGIHFPFGNIKGSGNPAFSVIKQGKEFLFV